MEAEGGTISAYVGYYGGPGPHPGPDGAGKAHAVKIRLAGGRTLIPDAVFDLERGDGRRQLHALEVCLDRGGTDRGRIVRQIEAHCEAMQDGTLSEALGLNRGYRLLCVFETGHSRDAVRQRLKDSGIGRDFGSLILFGTWAEARSSFGTGWIDVQGSTVVF